MSQVETVMLVVAALNAGASVVVLARLVIAGHRIAAEQPAGVEGQQ